MFNYLGAIPSMTWVYFFTGALGKRRQREYVVNSKENSTITQKPNLTKGQYIVFLLYCFDYSLRTNPTHVSHAGKKDI